MSQFTEQRTNQNEDEHSWTHLLPSNYYSELNQQYYVRFRRQSMLSLKDLRMRQPYPFEYARYL
ncbi:GH10722 [Drosophila grimshawi]|uniref:GH10722 n=2 Tax=Drosophila grimshawi TaxID=7222 RepID=B4JC10_DROGR|nr:GH10722 [Drosophila grimshawi]